MSGRCFARSCGECWACEWGNEQIGRANPEMQLIERMGSVIVRIEDEDVRARAAGIVVSGDVSGMRSMAARILDRWFARFMR